MWILLALTWQCRLHHGELGSSARSRRACHVSRALLHEAYHPQCVKLGLVGNAGAGKTSALRALAGLTRRTDELSTGVNLFFRGRASGNWKAWELVLNGEIGSKIFLQFGGPQVYHAMHHGLVGFPTF